MTTGHKHRIVRVKRDGVIHRALTATLLVTEDEEWVNTSTFAFGPVEDPCDCTHCLPRYRLTLLGVLHGLTGLTLKVQP